MIKTNTKGQTQFRVWLPSELKKDFQLHCVLTNTNMTVVTTKLIQQYLQDKRISGATQ